MSKREEPEDEDLKEIMELLRKSGQQSQARLAWTPNKEEIEDMKDILKREDTI